MPLAQQSVNGGLQLVVNFVVVARTENDPHTEV